MKLPSFIVFQSAPLTEARGDLRGAGFSVTIPTGFNPLPLPKQGEIEGPVVIARRIRVSIRSPYRSKGRFPTGAIRSCVHGRFQSAPLTEARGDSTSGSSSISFGKFQSAPLTEARGDSIPPTQAARSPRVSIRSPYRSKGRSESGTRAGEEFFRFNPLPLPKQGEIQLGVPELHHTSCFNPLPLPKQGEIRALRRINR